MKITNIVVTLLLLLGFSQAAELTAELRGSEGNKEVELDKFIKKLEDIGYSTVSTNKNIQIHYYNKYKEKNVEMLSFFSVLNKEKLRPLLLANPDFGAYAPFNFLAYKTLDIKKDNHTWYGHITADTMLNIIGEKDQNMRKLFTEMVDSLDGLATKEMKPTLTKKFERNKPLPETGLIKMVKKFDEPEDLEEFIEDFVGDHDGRFSKHNFIIAGFIDLKFEYEDMEEDFEKYDAYWVSLLCHFEFSNSIFNKGMPEAGMFAPCAIYFYIPKGKNELHVGYASVDNWINALNFKDKERIKNMQTIDSEVVEILEEMGFAKAK
ncbi:MAG: hypothetical protein DRQ78_04055 [Epsilonproteobacteria bacterium]|nr:MAG: hypothetical protein DRQ78_04055 [Campylobacterota bacterium]